MSLIVCAEIVLGMGLHHKYTYRFNELVGVEVRLAGELEEMGGKVPITYLYGGGITYIDVIQFQLPEWEISVVPEEWIRMIIIQNGQPVAQGQDGGAAALSGYVFLDADSAYREQMDSYRRPCAESSYFVVYDWRE